jgi:copper chaperone CopZ
MTVKITLSVPDMSCGHCVARIKKGLGEKDIECSVDLERKTVSVEASDEEAARLELERIDYPAEKPA